MRPTKLPYGKTHVAITSTHRFNCPATMAIETLEATSKYKKPKSVSITPTLPYYVTAIGRSSKAIGNLSNTRGPLNLNLKEAGWK
ncbi:hypothetical protein OUZ56_025295 [Daphnia magna]|uniref:Uncharacterized protein n=1 Tax=Daphnia magna TaxID=35525 RepID=A0ABQ9ZJE6_9CRUS|nr:hypothetical protein OUZ56_025295 [Daphnia magna]